MEGRERELANGVEKAGSVARFVNIIATRINQLQRGGKPLLDRGVEGMNALDIALAEFNEKRIGFKERADA